MEEREAVVSSSNNTENSSLAYKWVALGVVIMGAFMSILSSSLINVAIPKMMIVFSASTDQIQWVLTGYMLAMGMVIPVTGYLSDLIGTKRLYILALVVFITGSALCGMAWSINSIIGFRVIQAVGGGILMPVSMSIIYRVIPLHQRGLALGIWGIAAMAAPAIGPTLSGYIIEYLDWRLLFYVNIPVGLIAIFLASTLLQEFERKSHLAFDLLGFVSSSIFCFCFLLALAQGNQEGWSSPYIISMLFIAMVFLIIFIINELNHHQPLLNLRLFKNSVFTMSVIISSISTIGLFGGIFLVPLLLQNLMGLSPIQTGLIMFPAAIVTALFMPIGGRLFDLIGARPLVIVGLLVVGLGTLEIGHLTINAPFKLIIGILMVRGVGIGLSMMPATTAGMNTVPLAEVTRASALSNVIRQISASFGIAALTAIMQRQQSYHLQGLAENASASSPVFKSIMNNLQVHLVHQGSSLIDAKMQSSMILGGWIQKQALLLAINDTFMVAGFVCLFGIPLTLFLREKRFKKEDLNYGGTGRQD